MDTIVSKLLFAKVQPKQHTRSKELIVMTGEVRIEAVWKMHVVGTSKHRKAPSL